MVVVEVVIVVVVEDWVEDGGIGGIVVISMHSSSPLLH